MLKTALETLGKENVIACFIKTGLSTRNDQKRVDYFSRFLDFNLIKMELDIWGEKTSSQTPGTAAISAKQKSSLP